MFSLWLHRLFFQHQQQTLATKNNIHSNKHSIEQTSTHSLDFSASNSSSSSNPALRYQTTFKMQAPSLILALTMFFTSALSSPTPCEDLSVSGRCEYDGHGVVTCTSKYRCPDNKVEDTLNPYNQELNEWTCTNKLSRICEKRVTCCPVTRPDKKKENVIQAGKNAGEVGSVSGNESV